jgi:hypothetical protein
MIKWMTTTLGILFGIGTMLLIGGALGFQLGVDYYHSRSFIAETGASRAYLQSVFKAIGAGLADRYKLETDSASCDKGFSLGPYSVDPIAGSNLKSCRVFAIGRQNWIVVGHLSNDFDLVVSSIP